MILAHRHPDWEPRLTACVADWTGRDYVPARGGDCVAFVMAAVDAVHGAPLALALRPYKSVGGQARVLLGMGWADLLAAADACFGERIAPLQAHRGDVVSDGSILGMMTAAGAAAFGEDGMVMMQRGSIVAAWPIGRAS